MKIFRYPLLLLALCSALCSTCYARSYHRMSLPNGVVGPETIAFNYLETGSYVGPYVGVSDGRILRWDQPSLTWTTFATMPNWSPRCSRVNGPLAEPSCGRPLGLKFHPTTGDLYVADAYHGLVVVGRGGGRGESVATSAEGVPFKFTNSLDIDPQSGVVYFTDSSTQFERWRYQSIIDTGESTGRLMTYDPSSKTVRVLLHNLRFANGVALSQDMDFLLFSETTTSQIHKFWLKGPRYLISDVLITLRGRPDNINRAPDGNFWIAQVPLPNGRSGDGGMPVKINGEGHILDRLDRQSGALIPDASDVKEFDGRVWIGNVVNPYIEVVTS